MGMNGSNTANAPQSELYEYQPSQQSSQQPAFGGFGFNSGALSAGGNGYIRRRARHCLQQGKRK